MSDLERITGDPDQLRTLVISEPGRVFDWMLTRSSYAYEELNNAEEGLYLANSGLVPLPPIEQRQSWQVELDSLKAGSLLLSSMTGTQIVVWDVDTVETGSVIGGILRLDGEIGESEFSEIMDMDKDYGLERFDSVLGATLALNSYMMREFVEL